MADTKQAFLALFGAYMKDGDRRQLFAFIDSQPVAALRECLAAYFKADTSQQQRVRSRAVFVRLVVTASGKDLHFALFADAMIHIARSPWQVHYQELSGGEKNTVDKAIEAQKRTMPPIDRQFAEHFRSYMTDKRVTLNKIAAFLHSHIAANAQRCVGLYIAMSPWYEKGNDEASLDIFFIASYEALRPGEAGYARTYGAKIEEEFSVWHTRFNSLRPKLQEQLRTRMKQAATPANPAAGDAAAQQKPGSLSADQKQFVQLYRRYVDSGERAAMNNFQRFLVGRSAEALAGYVLVYLDDSARHYGEPPNHRSSQIFVGALSAAITKNSAYYAFRVKSLIDSPDTIWNRRFAALDLLQYGNALRSQLDAAIKTKARFIDDLRIAYFLKYQRDPDIAALRNFEPVTVPPQVLERLMDSIVHLDMAIDLSRTTGNLEWFDKAFTAVSQQFDQQKDLPTLWVMVKRSRERAKLTPQYRDLVYFMGVGLLYIAAAQKHPEGQRDGFNADEQALFFDLGQPDDRYFSDYAAQVAIAVWKHAGRPPKLRAPRGTPEADVKPDDTYTAMMRSEGLLQVSSDRLRLTLTPLVEAAYLRGAVEEAWTTHKKQVEAMRIPIDAGKGGVTQLKVGQTFGNFFVLWWDEQHHTVYLQVNGFEQVVFETGQERLAQLYGDHSFYGVVAENTQHLLELIPFIFDILGYLPDLVSGGLIGLAKSIVFNLAFEKSMNALGIDPMKAQLLMLGASLLIHGVTPKEAEGVHVDDTVEIHEETWGLDAQGTKEHGTDFHGAEDTHTTVDPAHGDDPAHALTDSKFGAKGPFAANDNRAIAAEARGAAPAPYSDITRKRVEKLQEQVQAEANRFAQESGEAAQQQLAVAAGAETHGGVVGDSKVLPTGAANENRMVASRGGAGGGPGGGGRQSPVTRQLELVSQRQQSHGASYRIGDRTPAVDAKVMESLRSGRHVYLYYDRQGRLLYVGKSGGNLQHHDWIQRLQSDHIGTGWIDKAASVTVYYDLTNQEMWALEEVMIGRDPTNMANERFYALENKQAGRYTQDYGELDLGIDAQHALDKPSARFRFVANTTPR